MPSKPNQKVQALWVQLWASPQAVAWEELGWTRAVARYAQVLIKAEGPSSTAALLGEVRQMEDRLGLSPMAMRRLQWDIKAAPPAGSSDADVVSISSFRDL